ncbi:MAG: GNAT family N-acetyltransferase [Gemmatimonadaceae bacterium]
MTSNLVLGEETADRHSYSVAVLRHSGPERERLESELMAAGVPLPLTHRLVWARAGLAASSWFVAARDSYGRPRAGFAIDVSRSQALPGHLLLRADRLNVATDSAALEACIATLRQLAYRDRRILRVNLELFGRNEDARHRLRSLLERSGFTRVPESRMYEQTLVMDLNPDEQALFAALSSSARRNVRELAKQPYTLQVISDPRLGDRLNALLLSAMARRGADVQPVDWSRVIELSRTLPEASRLVGVFREGACDADALVGFAWARAHGDHVEYYLGAAARDMNCRLAPGYPLLWDLIAWAKRIGAAWFDFGGVTAGSHEATDDKLGGISDFKRFFSRSVASVAEEWQLDPHPSRTALAVVISRSAKWIQLSRERLAARRM